MQLLTVICCTLLKFPTGCSLTEIQGLLSAQLRPACEGPRMACLTSWSLPASTGLVLSAECPASPPPCFCSNGKHHALQAGQSEMGSGSRTQESSLLNSGYSGVAMLPSSPEGRDFFGSHLGPQSITTQP